MPYKLNGTYYTLSEIAEEYSIGLSAMSRYLERGGYEKLTIGGKRGGISLIHEDEVKRIRQDRYIAWGRTNTLESSAKRLGCSISDLLENVKHIKAEGDDKSKWRMRSRDLKLLEALRDSKTKGIDWSKAKVVMDALNN